MTEFLQSYGIWILLGLFFLLMLRGHGMCCGIGNHHEHHGKNKWSESNEIGTDGSGPSA